MSLEADHFRKIRWVAMEFLARREHSVQELETKLLRKFPDDNNIIVAALQDLVEQNLLSDRRFAEAYCHMRFRKGFGPLRVQQELQMKGVSCEVYLDVFESISLDWFERCVEVLRKKYHHAPCSLAQESQYSRFLQYRGFSFDQIQYALDTIKSVVE